MGLQYPTSHIEGLGFEVLWHCQGGKRHVIHRDTLSCECLAFSVNSQDRNIDQGESQTKESHLDAKKHKHKRALLQLCGKEEGS